MSVRHAAMALALLAAAAAARGGEPDAFHAAVADAWRFYRGAVFYLRTDNAMVAGFELDQMRERWEAVRERYAGAPPGPYAGVPGFDQALAEVGGRTARAASSAAAGEVKAAAAELASVRRVLARLRSQAGVRVFSDCIDEVNAAMDALYVYRRAEPLDVEDLAQVNDVKAKAAVLGQVLERCDAAAEAAVREDPEFRRLVDGMLASSAAVFPALDRKDTTAVINLLRELHSFDRILYLRFG